MLKQIFDLPDNVLGIAASGKVTAEDYEAVLVPALEEKLSKVNKVRFLYVLGEEFDSISGAAAWEDAKVGLKHITHFEKIAVVTDVDWIRNSIKVLGFALPGQTRVFENDNLHNAREWISTPEPEGDLTFDFLDEQGVLILSPKGALDAADFARVATAINPYIEKQGALSGIMIVADSFPGWHDISALTAHLRFVKDHRKNVNRLAIVSDSRMLSALPYLAKNLLVNEARHFPTSEKSDALAWVSQGSA